jgi:poly-gamma-glutamate synthesis protein (capsule biosynthesis protein)
MESTPASLPSPTVASPAPITLLTGTPSVNQTSRPPVTLAVSPEWTAVGTTAIETLNAGSTIWDWQLSVADDPTGQLESHQAHVALVLGDHSTIVWQEPLVLAVPFTADWEHVTWAEAQAISNAGHPLVTVMPWSQISAISRALRIDGLAPDHPDYPLQSTWSLAAAPGYEEAIFELARALQAANPPDPVVHLAAVGDIMLDRDLGEILQQGDLAYPFANVADLLSAADVTVGNFESALGDVGQPAAKRYTFQSPPQAAESLALAGFDVLSLANNHALDYGPEALFQSIKLLEAQGIATIGGGADNAAARMPHLRKVNGLTLAFLAYVDVPLESSNFDAVDWTATDTTPGLAWAIPEQMQADVAAARRQADLVIVVLHSGFEFQAVPSSPQMAAARTAIDAGADLVIGHHAHVLQGIEFYNGGAIVYGLGDFAFVSDGVKETAILNVWLDSDGVRQLEVVPVILDQTGQPRLATAEEATAIHHSFYSLTEMLN